MTGEALKVFQEYSWPGNIRELGNLIERIVTLSKDDHIDTAHLPKDIIHSKPNNNGTFSLEEGSLMKAVRIFEKKIIIEALRYCNGNQTSTAKTLGIHRTTLISKLEAYGIKD
jgi:DNA-binding NtrC family response regulator